MISSKVSRDFVVTTDMIDENNHVGNIKYIELMLDIAVWHSDSVGCTDATRAMGASWFVRSHFIEYKLPMTIGTEFRLTTWIDETDTLRSMRKYRFSDPSTDRAFAEAQTEWILVDIASGRPKRIPQELINLFVSPRPGKA